MSPRLTDPLYLPGGKMLLKAGQAVADPVACCCTEQATMVCELTPCYPFFILRPCLSPFAWLLDAVRQRQSVVPNPDTLLPVPADDVVWTLSVWNQVKAAIEELVTSFLVFIATVGEGAGDDGSLQPWTVTMPSSPITTFWTLAGWRAAAGIPVGGFITMGYPYFDALLVRKALMLLCATPGQWYGPTEWTNCPKYNQDSLPVSPEINYSLRQDEFDPIGPSWYTDFTHAAQRADPLLSTGLTWIESAPGGNTLQMVFAEDDGGAPMQYTWVSNWGGGVFYIGKAARYAYARASVGSAFFNPPRMAYFWTKVGPMGMTEPEEYTTFNNTPALVKHATPGSWFYLGHSNLMRGTEGGDYLVSVNRFGGWYLFPPPAPDGFGSPRIEWPLTASFPALVGWHEPTVGQERIDGWTAGELASVIRWEFSFLNQPPLLGKLVVANDFRGVIGQYVNYEGGAYQIGIPTHEEFHLQLEQLPDRSIFTVTPALLHFDAIYASCEDAKNQTSGTPWIEPQTIAPDDPGYPAYPDCFYDWTGNSGGWRVIQGRIGQRFCNVYAELPDTASGVIRTRGRCFEVDGIVTGPVEWTILSFDSFSTCAACCPHVCDGWCNPGQDWPSTLTVTLSGMLPMHEGTTLCDIGVYAGWLPNPCPWEWKFTGSDFLTAAGLNFNGTFTLQRVGICEYAVDVPTGIFLVNPGYTIAPYSGHYYSAKYTISVNVWEGDFKLSIGMRLNCLDDVMGGAVDASILLTVFYAHGFVPGGGCYQPMGAGNILNSELFFDCMEGGWADRFEAIFNWNNNLGGHASIVPNH
jgi:hypothetical protein